MDSPTLATWSAQRELYSRGSPKGIAGTDPLSAEFGGGTGTCGQSSPKDIRGHEYQAGRRSQRYSGQVSTSNVRIPISRPNGPCCPCGSSTRKTQEQTDPARRGVSGNHQTASPFSARRTVGSHRYPRRSHCTRRPRN